MSDCKATRGGAAWTSLTHVAKVSARSLLQLELCNPPPACGWKQGPGLGGVRRSGIKGSAGVDPVSLL